MSIFHSSATFRVGAIVMVAGLASAASGQEYRSYDGAGNNESNPTWGATGTRLRRMCTMHYGDGFASMGGQDRPNARAVSNVLFSQGPERIISQRVLTDAFTFWGQLLDHDLDLTDGGEEIEMIQVPVGDPDFDPGSSGGAMIPFRRANFDHATGGGPGDPRMHVNQISAYIDASMIYGSDQGRADAIRSFTDGKLLVSPGNLLPFNTMDLPNGNPMGRPAAELFVAGDVRTNENPALAAYHTIFVREHNRLCDELKAANPGWDDEKLYQEARRWVGAFVQGITYNEWLPAILGEGHIPEYTGYNPDVNAQVSAEFSTGCFRVGHTLLNSHVLRLNEDRSASAFGHLELRSNFFRPEAILDEGGIDPILRGITFQASQEIDNHLTTEVRSFVFGAGSGGLDLGAVNIQRGRDMGLPSYTRTRKDLGLAPAKNFSDITTDTDTRTRLRDAYGNVTLVDLWAISEDHLPGASIGETLATIFVDQFVRARDGDRFFYLNTMTPDEIAVVNATFLSDIILRNTDIEWLQDHVFLATADFNRDANVNSDDFQAFLLAFAQGDPTGDYNKDGQFNSDDMVWFLATFSAGF